MRLKVLGAYGASDAEHNLTGYLLDDWLAVDAGTLTSKLSFAQQARIQAVFISHSHADHIRDLPHLIHNRFSQNATSLVVFAAREVMDLLTRDVFTGTAVSDTPLKTTFFPGTRGRYSTAGLPVICELIVGKSGQTMPLKTSRVRRSMTSRAAKTTSDVAFWLKRL